MTSIAINNWSAGAASGTGSQFRRQDSALVGRLAIGLAGAALALAPGTGAGIQHARFCSGTKEILFLRDGGYQWAPFDEHSQTSSPEETAKSDTASEAALRIQWLRDQSGLSMSTLAELLGVSRKAVYDWLSGTLPREQRAAHLALIYSAMERVPEPLRTAVPAVMDEMVSGSTLRELLSNSEVDGQVLAQKVDNVLEELRPLMASISKRRSFARAEDGFAVEPYIRST